MRTFEEIRRKFRAIGVRAADDPDLAGVINLNGPESLLVLSGDNPYWHKKGANGWFDVTVEAANGDILLLHNAIETKHSTHSHNRKAETHIYPNVVVIGQRKNLKEVKFIGFKLVGLKHFFHYEHIEFQDLWRAPPELMKALLALRKSNAEWLSAEFGGTERKDELFHPGALYITHRVPRAFKFRLHTRCYEIGFGGHSRGLGWGNIEIQVDPVAQISFDEPVNLDQALDAVWEWQNFFVQIAMEPMPVEAISTRADKGEQSPAHVYLPVSEEPSKNSELRGLHPAYIPYNRWNERQKLATAMRGWLEKQDERRQFRAVLGRVIRDMHRRSDIENVLRLCAAIESLPELDQGSDVSKKHIKDMAAGALSIAVRDNIPVSGERIQNALSVLRRSSLPARLRHLSEKLQHLLSLDDCKLIANAAHGLRNTAAHGRAHVSFQNPLVAPVVTALAAMCAVYDLSTSGMQPISGEGRINSLRTWEQSVGELRWVNSQEPHTAET
ncbi:hypothetical protein ILFOPFJJ_01592 [Ensifer psoraleae]|uniref:hypothetical protein n=1 Tax=Sinorhizobium psoraleae TaxID=520838 RepID=UPI00156856CC|nr:hypothetical protein [Sinorhizobium psoraleae]NRP70711.1 hypothetical protein [Sinorhizobium psoraleae]